MGLPEYVVADHDEGVRAKHIVAAWLLLGSLLTISITFTLLRWGWRKRKERKKAQQQATQQDMTSRGGPQGTQGGMSRVLACWHNPTFVAVRLVLTTLIDLATDIQLILVLSAHKEKELEGIDWNDEEEARVAEEAAYSLLYLVCFLFAPVIICTLFITIQGMPRLKNSIGWTCSNLLFPIFALLTILMFPFLVLVLLVYDAMALPQPRADGLRSFWLELDIQKLAPLYSALTAGLETPVSLSVASVMYMRYRASSWWSFWLSVLVSAVHLALECSTLVDTLLTHRGDCRWITRAFDGLYRSPGGRTAEVSMIQRLRPADVMHPPAMLHGAPQEAVNYGGSPMAPGPVCGAYMITPPDDRMQGHPLGQPWPPQPAYAYSTLTQGPYGVHAGATHGPGQPPYGPQHGPVLAAPAWPLTMGPPPWTHYGDPSGHVSWNPQVAHHPWRP